MEDTCRRAAEIGLPALAFTEHADFTLWSLPPGQEVPDDMRHLVSEDVLTPPPLDLDGYRDCLQRCRELFPGLRILSGVELGEPHWHAEPVAALLGEGGFDRVLASVHSSPADDGFGVGGIGGFTEISVVLRSRDPAAVLRGYLAETAELISRFAAFDVLAHIDYPVRYWPRQAGPCDPYDFEEEYRHVLQTLADADKALEINTEVPLHPEILAWWRDQGGQAITFASDAHEPAVLAAGFADAARMADAAGFTVGSDPWGFWCRKTVAGQGWRPSQAASSA